MARKLIFKTPLIAFAACLILSACSNGVKEKIGLNRTSPDEFQVVTRAPLEVPEDLRTTHDIKSLPTPMPGAPRPQEISASERAKAALLGKSEEELKQEALRQIQANNSKSNDIADTEISAAENDFLTKVTDGQNLPDSNELREKLAAEQKQYIEENQPVIQKLGIVDNYVQQGDTLDPEKEAERLRKENIAKRVTGAPSKEASQEEEKTTQPQAKSSVEESFLKEINTQSKENQDDTSSVELEAPEINEMEQEAAAQETSLSSDGLSKNDTVEPSNTSPTSDTQMSESKTPLENEGANTPYNKLNYTRPNIPITD